MGLAASMAADHLVAVRTPQTYLWLEETGIIYPSMTYTLAKRKLNLFPRFRMISTAAWCYFVRGVEASPAIRALKEEEIQELLPVIGNLGLCFVKWIPAEAACVLGIQIRRR